MFESRVDHQALSLRHGALEVVLCSVVEERALRLRDHLSPFAVAGFAISSR